MWVYVAAGAVVGQVIFWLFVLGPLTRWMGTLWP
jgi:hypothetical protein